MKFRAAVYIYTVREVPSITELDATIFVIGGWLGWRWLGLCTEGLEMEPLQAFPSWCCLKWSRRSYCSPVPQNYSRPLNTSPRYNFSSQISSPGMQPLCKWWRVIGDHLTLACFKTTPGQVYTCMCVHRACRVAELLHTQHRDAEQQTCACPTDLSCKSLFTCWTLSCAFYCVALACRLTSSTLQHSIYAHILS